MARPHDIFFRHVFQTPERTASLLRVAAKKSPSLKEFIEAVNLDSLQEISGTFAESGETGAADLAFTVNLKCDSAKNAELLVGLIEEHKSSPDGNVINQLMTYWYKLMFRKMQNIPTVALIIYNGKHPWNPLRNCMFPEYPDYFQRIGLPFICEFLNVGGSFDLAELSKLDSKSYLAMLAMKYAFDGAEVERYFVPAFRAFLGKCPADQAAFVDEIMIYLKGSLEKKDKEHFMDLITTKEAYGYETIADAELAEAKALGEAIGEARLQDQKLSMAKALLLHGVQIQIIATTTGLSEAEILAL